MGQGDGTAHGRLSIRRMATALGMSKSEVHRDAQAGMPMTGVEAAREWRRQHEDLSRTREGRIDRPEMFGRPDAPATVLALPATEEPDEPPQPGDTAEYRRARAERERTRADREALELERMRGNLIDVDEASRLAFTAFRGLRDAIENVPARVKDQLAAEADPFRVELVLQAELTGVLASFDAESAVREKEDEGDDE